MLDLRLLEISVSSETRFGLPSEVTVFICYLISLHAVWSRPCSAQSALKLKEAMTPLTSRVFDECPRGGSSRRIKWLPLARRKPNILLKVERASTCMEFLLWGIYRARNAGRWEHSRALSWCTSPHYHRRQPESGNRRNPSLSLLALIVPTVEQFSMPLLQFCLACLSARSFMGAFV
jgi:hypothetical protein